MKRLLWLILPVMLLSLTGCKDDATLVVRNSSDGWLNVRVDDNGIYELDPWDYLTSTWSLSTSILGDDSRKVLVEYSGLYVFSGSTRVTVTAGETRKFSVYSDGGAIRIYNDSNIFTIEEVYLMPSSESGWGEDDLYGEIGPDEYSTWTVTPGYWDVMVVDDWGDEFYSYSNYIDYDELLSLTYTGFRASGAGRNQKTGVPGVIAEGARSEQKRAD